MRRKQLYLPETNILVTRFLTLAGVAEIIDFMPIKTTKCLTHQHHIIRAVHLVRGSLPLEMVCRPAFNYARDEHTVTLSSDGALFHSETLCLGLASTVPLAEDGRGGVHAHFTLHTGQWAYFILESARYNDITPQCLAHHQYEVAFRETMDYWQRWLSQCKYQGRWREMVQRSALALKLLTEPSQKAPFFRYGDEWLFLLEWGIGAAQAGAKHKKKWTKPLKIGPKTP